jgi:hypothetical protein
MHAQPAHKYINIMIWTLGGRGRQGGTVVVTGVGLLWDVLAVTHYPLAYSPVPLPTPSRAYMPSELRLGKPESSSIQSTRGSNPQVLIRNTCLHTTSKEET